MVDNEPLYTGLPEKVIVKTQRGDTPVHIYNNNNNNKNYSEKKKTVIMTHGAGGRKEQFHQGRMVQRLACRYRVITFDWYGHGESPHVTNDEPYTKQLCLEQLCHVVQELIPPNEQFHLYGFSMGCFLSLCYCAQHNHRVEKLVLHSPWNGEMTVFAPGIRTAVQLPLIGIAGVSVIRSMDFPYTHDAQTFKNIVLHLGDGDDAWNELLEQVATAPQPSKLFIICGEGEKPFHTVAKGIHEKLKEKATLVSYPEAQHMTWCEQWDQPVGTFYRDHIFNFLAADR